MLKLLSLKKIIRSIQAVLDFTNHIIEGAVEKYDKASLY